MPQANIVQFLRSNNPLPPIVQQAGSEAETQTADDAGLNRLIAEIGAQAVFDRYFGPNGSDSRAGLFTLSSDGQSVNYRSDAENSGGGLSGLMESELAPAALFGLGAAAIGPGLGAATSAGAGAGGAGAAGAGAGMDALGMETLGSLGSWGGGTVGGAAAGAGAAAGGLEAATGGSMDLPIVDDWSNWMTPNNTSVASGDMGLWDVTGDELGAGVNGSSTLGAATGSSLPNWLRQGLSSLFGGSGSGSSSFPWGDVIGALLDSYGSNQQRDDLTSLMNRSLEYIDPFHEQRPQYQTQFRNLTQNPSNFFDDPAISSIIDQADETTSRRLASQGYNMSGNFANEVARTRMNTAFQNYLPYADMIGTAAGYRLSPGNVGAATNVGTAAANAGQQTMGGLGNAFDSTLSGLGWNQDDATRASAARQQNLDRWRNAGINTSLSSLFGLS